ncbi:DUF3159 domain-containing protein [Pseudonocardia sp.]|uniref:DUF3159 domain-containing protein n=1 Tax=Pseudonocardia sp. TaxID=60912 RepID=UPI003D0F7997
MAPSDPASRAGPAVGGPSLREVLGGRGGAVDASIPVAVFVVAWLVAEATATRPAVAWAAGAALVAGTVVAAVRFARGERPRAVLLGLLGVAAAAGVALWTGRAVDFFLLQMVGNAASALVWAVSIVVRWPLLGVVVGTVLGQRTRWRRDPALLRAYQRASWVWVGQYVVRLAVFTPLYLAGAVVALGVARVVLTAPLVFACIVVSWWVLRAALPPGHPGLRHPQG